MDHLDAIDIDLAAKRPHKEIARKIFLTYPSKAFNGEEESQFRILNEVALHFRVPITCLQVAGSAKIGHSLHKNTPFTPGKSDLDLAIINSGLFASLMERALEISRGYTDGTVFTTASGASFKDEYLRYLARGIFRPDLMPTGPARAEIRNFFGQLSAKHTKLFKSISAAIYLSEGCFEMKQRSVIKRRATKDVL